MEYYLPNKVPETDNFRRDWNKLLDYLRRLQPQTSTDVLVSQGTHGTSFMVSDRIKKKIAGEGGWQWQGTYDENKAYAVNDVVYVDFHNSYTVPFTVESGSRTPALTAGVFLCVVDVPASGSRDTTYNYYYPICPTIPSSSVVTVSGSVANKTFWQPITPLFPMKICVGGQGTTNGYVSWFPSDPFPDSQLPYTGSSS